MTKNELTLSPEIVQCINTLQTGGAELWNNTLRKAIYCAACNDDYKDADERLKLVQELMYLQDTLETFIIKEGGNHD